MINLNIVANVPNLLLAILMMIYKALCTSLPQMSGQVKYFKDGGKIVSFKIEDDNILIKHNEIWNNVKKTFSTKFHSQPIFDKKYIKILVKTFNSVINSIFSENKIPKESIHYICIH